MITPNKAKNIIRGCLGTHGFSLLPKGDGRVELPQKLIQLLPWKNIKEVYLFETLGGLIVSTNPEYDKVILSRVVVNSGRIRLPFGILKQLGLDKRSLVASIDEDNSILIRNEGEAAQLARTIDTIPDDVAINIANVLGGQAISVPQKEKFELIIPSTRLPITFRPLQDPYRFKGSWDGKNNNIVIGSSYLTNNFYLIGGYERMGQGKIRVGYLLASDVLYDSLRSAMSRARNMRVDTEWIIKFDPSIREEFRVFNSPWVPHPKGAHIAQLFSEEKSLEFLLETFPKMKSSLMDQITDPPLVINNVNFKRGEE